MSIQSFTETLLANIEKTFENEANKLLNEARQRTGNESYTAGRMDGLSDAVRQIHETYALFVKSESDPKDDDAKSLY
jgi:hypothetical protein